MSATQRVLIYKRFERFWHWAQAILVILLAVTGLDIHFAGIDILGFDLAVRMHMHLAWAFLILIVFAIFWHFTTGEWRQYVPTRLFLREMIEFYLIGIFRNAPHPVKKTLVAKLNPLQRLAYLSLKILLIPCLVTTGLLYSCHYYWPMLGLGGLSLRTVAILHTLSAYLMIAFVLAHIYLTTTGQTPLSNLKAMITGWEDIEIDGSDGVSGGAVGS